MSAQARKKSLNVPIIHLRRSQSNTNDPLPVDVLKQSNYLVFAPGPIERNVVAQIMLHDIDDRYTWHQYDPHDQPGQTNIDAAAWALPAPHP